MRFKRGFSFMGNLSKDALEGRVEAARGLRIDCGGYILWMRR